MTTGNTIFCSNEVLARHTTFRVGGPADFYFRPQETVASLFIEQALYSARQAQLESKPLFVLGGGANILAADSGFRGVVLDTTDYTGCLLEQHDDKTELVVKAGMKSDDIADYAAQRGQSGVEFLAGLPGTIGGAIWMNARCYDTSVSDVLGEVIILDEAGRQTAVPFKAEDYAYKQSPFQKRSVVILEARLNVHPKERALIYKTMKEYRADRKAKGHFTWPSAGSVFKNNRSWGRPTGKIIEELGLRGRQIGGAQIAPWHGNFIINIGNAAATDIYSLIRLVEEEAAHRLGITLEREIILLGFENE
jgi:UDP-N-acetylmuramate dehydrogenase